MASASGSFEELVEQAIGRLEFAQLGTVYRNRRYEGLRQPGSYEIDIALEFCLDDVARFLVIVECKDLSRPVDRPAIQKLIQTRDALSAHKAIFASTSGYTAEAVLVASAHRIALWTLIENESIDVVCHSRRKWRPSRFLYREDFSNRERALLGELQQALVPSVSRKEVSQRSVALHMDMVAYVKSDIPSGGRLRATRIARRLGAERLEQHVEAMSMRWLDVVLRDGQSTVVRTVQRWAQESRQRMGECRYSQPAQDALIASVTSRDLKAWERWCIENPFEPGIEDWEDRPVL